MASIATEFELDHTITVPGSSVGIRLSGATEPAVLLGIEQNNVFPGGDVAIGHIAFGGATGDDVVFKAGQAKVSFGASVHARIDAGIFTSSSAAIAALQMPD